VIEFSLPIFTELFDAGLEPGEVTRIVETALEEDLRHGPDVTSEATVARDAVTTASITARESGVLGGLPIALAVFDRVAGHDLEIRHHVPDGSRTEPGMPVLTVRASTRALLAAERTALNLLCLLSGVATTTAAWVRAVQGTGVGVRDTRKTVPGLRAAQKYAVRLGGGVNHRMSLGDAVLIKDNHIRAAGSVVVAFTAARMRAPELSCEVEVDSLAQLDDLLPHNPEFVLLDNFTPAQCAEAVRRRGRRPVSLEASGGLSLATARSYAETGVDFLAVGALTHSAPALDLGFDFE
jgi:nicotinate-nucleotide pyrophosphorylase (carboxylating)